MAQLSKIFEILLQIRFRIHEDLSNKTPEQALELPKTLNFVKEHLGVREISGQCLLVIYNFAFTNLKYMNSKVASETQNTAEKKNATSARLGPWIYVMQRVEADRKAERDWSMVKERLSQLLSSGQDFEPL